MKCTRQRCQVVASTRVNGGLDALVGVGDHELDAAKPAADQLAEERGPERLGLGEADVHAEHLAAPLGRRADGDDHRQRHDAPVLARLHVGGVDPDVAIDVERPVEKGLDALVDIGAEPADLALGHAAHPQRPDQVVHPPGRDPVDVCLLDHRDQRPVDAAPRVQEPGKVAPLPQLREAQRHAPGRRLPVAIAVAVALHQPRRILHPPGGAGEARHLELHQPPRGEADHLAQQIGVGGLLHQPLQVHHLIGHRDLSGSGWSVSTRPYRDSAR